MRADHITEWTTFSAFPVAPIQHAFIPPKKMSETPQETRIQLAIQAIRGKQVKSIRAAVQAYNVPKTTLLRRMADKPSRAEARANSMNLTKQEEDILVKYIIDLDDRGFAPRIQGVEDMANEMLAARRASPVGKRWAYRFTKRRAELQTRFSRAYDFQRALCEDPDIMAAWFELVSNMRAKYGIDDTDFYNFDETGFMMGVITSAPVVTRSDRIGRRKKVQPGNREWVTAIACVSGDGFAVPPFLVVKGQYHLENWYTEGGLPPSWAIKTTANGWTDNETGLDWIRHFDQHTTARTKGAFRMLVVDGHESHQTVEFQAFCKEKNIISVSLPPHSSHLTQPLDVGCFSPLKVAYGREIESFIKSSVTHITKVEFFLAFQAAYKKAFTKENILGGFRGAGLVPFDPDAVISKLDVQIQTPDVLRSSPPPSDVWNPSTPSNATEALSQSAYVRRRIEEHQGSSPSKIFEAVKQMAKGMELISQSLTLTNAELRTMAAANQALSKRKRAPKKRLVKGGPLSVGDTQDKIDQDALATQIKKEMSGPGGRSRRAAATVRRCGNCGEPGHNIRTCQADVEEISDDESD
jgi:hypothetical protein